MSPLPPFSRGGPLGGWVKKLQTKEMLIMSMSLEKKVFKTRKC